MWIIDGWMFLGLYGVPYLTLVIAAFLIMRRLRPFVVSNKQLAAILFPIAMYLFLIFVVKDRQGFNWGYANLAMAFPAIITVVLATRSSIAYWAGIAVTSVTGISAWLIIPMQGLTRLF